MNEGNFHAALIFRNKEEYSKVQDLSKRVIERALRMDGTCESCTGFQNTDAEGDLRAGLPRLSRTCQLVNQRWWFKDARLAADCMGFDSWIRSCRSRQFFGLCPNPASLSIELLFSIDCDPTGSSSLQSPTLTIQFQNLGVLAPHQAGPFGVVPRGNASSRENFL
jgi:hypothetical protein